MSEATDETKALVLDLLEQLKAKGWTIAAIADAIGIPWVTVERWRLGLRQPAHASAIAIALTQLLQRKRIPKKRRYKGKRNSS